MLRKCIFAVAATAVFGGLFAAPSHALTITGDIKLVAPLSDVRPDADPNNHFIRVFQEKSEVTSKPIKVDFTAPGTYTSKPSPVTLPAGLKVEDYFFHSDVKPGTRDHNYTGTITFDTPILGVIFSSNLLDKTDSVLGLPTTQYPNGDGERGLEFNGTEQVKFIGPSTLDVTFATVGNVDEMRVLVADNSRVPEPGSIALLCSLGAAGLSVLRQRRRKSA